MQDQDNLNNEHTFGVSPSGPPTAPGTPTNPAAVVSAAKTSGMAVASMVVGILALLIACVSICLQPVAVLSFVLALVGLVLGIFGRRAISRSDGELLGGGMALAGIITSAIAEALSLLAIVVMIMFVNVIKTAIEDRPSSRVGRQLFERFETYAGANSSMFPPASDWRDIFEEKYSVSEKQLMHWAMNEELSDWKMHEIPDPANTTLVYQVEPGAAAAGTGDNMYFGPFGTGTGYVVTVNGNVLNLRVDSDRSLLWKPEEGAP